MLCAASAAQGGGGSRQRSVEIDVKDGGPSIGARCETEERRKFTRQVR